MGWATWHLACCRCAAGAAVAQCETASRPPAPPWWNTHAPPTASSVCPRTTVNSSMRPHSSRRFPHHPLSLSLSFFVKLIFPGKTADQKFRKMRIMSLHKQLDDSKFRKMRLMSLHKQLDDSKFRKMRIMSLHKQLDDSKFRKMRIMSLHKQLDDSKFRKMRIMSLHKQLDYSKFRKMRIMSLHKQLDDSKFRKMRIMSLQLDYSKGLFMSRALNNEA